MANKTPHLLPSLGLEPSSRPSAQATRWEAPQNVPSPAPSSERAPGSGPPPVGSLGVGLALQLLGGAGQPAGQRSRELAREAGAGGRRGGQGQSAPTSQFPCESTILLNRIMDFKMPRKAESAIRWAALLLLTTASFSAGREEINQTMCAMSESLGSIRCREINNIYYKPQIKGKRHLGVSHASFIL